MSRSFWTLRLALLRLIPHTPVKRWIYSAGLIIAVGLAVLRLFPLAVLDLALVVTARLYDLRRNRGRRPKLNTRRAYFFEGPDSDT